jgi:hypothetical protein
MFYVALADIAVRKYIKPDWNKKNKSGVSGGVHKKLAFTLGTDPSTKINGESVRGALHSLLLNNILSILAKFWLKIGLEANEGTAIVAGSPERKRAITQFGNGIGRTPEKRASGWEQKHAVVGHLESMMKSSAVLRAFHLYEQYNNSSQTLNFDTKEEEKTGNAAVPTKDNALLDALIYGERPIAKDTVVKTKKPVAQKKPSKRVTHSPRKTLNARAAGNRRTPTLALTSGHQPRIRPQPHQQSQPQVQRQQQNQRQYETISGASRRMSASLSAMSIAGTQLYQDTDGTDGATDMTDMTDMTDHDVNQDQLLATQLSPSKQTPQQNIVDQVVEHPASPRAKQFMKELHDLHELLEHVKQTANYNDSAMMFVPATELGLQKSSGSENNNTSPARVHVHRSGSIDVSVYNRSGMMSELNGAALDNEQKDQELSSLLGSVRSKLNQLRHTIGQDSIAAPDLSPTPAAPEAPVPTPPVAPEEGEYNTIPEPGTPGISLDMRDLMEEEAATISETKQQSSSNKRIGRPPPTKSSLLRQKLSHGEMDKPTSSFIFPKSATKIQRNRRDSFMKSSSLEQQWSAGRKEKRKDSAAHEKQQRQKQQEHINGEGKTTAPPPHVQRRMQRRAMGLPNRHKLQNEISGWRPPVCGYSSFSVKGAKFGGKKQPSPQKQRKRGRKKTTATTTVAAVSSQVHSSPGPTHYRNGSKHQYNQNIRSGSKSSRHTSAATNTTTENGDFEIVFSRELQVRIVKLRQVLVAEEGTDNKVSRVEIAEQKDSIVHCRILLSRHANNGRLKSVRVLLTQPEEDNMFHFRHFADQELFDSIKGKLKLDVSFDKYPETLNNIFDSTTNPKEQTDLILAIHSDGRARLQAMKVLFGVRKVEILSLNFLRSEKEVIKEYADGLNVG